MKGRMGEGKTINNKDTKEDIVKAPLCPLWFYFVSFVVKDLLF